MDAKTTYRELIKEFPNINFNIEGLIGNVQFTGIRKHKGAEKWDYYLVSQKLGINGFSVSRIAVGTLDENITFSVLKFNKKVLIYNLLYIKIYPSLNLF